MPSSRAASSAGGGLLHRPAGSQTNDPSGPRGGRRRVYRPQPDAEPGGVLSRLRHLHDRRIHGHVASYDDGAEPVVQRKKGTAIAISGEGNYIGGLLLVPALAWAVNPDHIGWSTTAFGLGILFVTLAVPVSLIMRERPEQYGLLPDGDDPGAAREPCCPGPPQGGRSGCPRPPPGSRPGRRCARPPSGTSPWVSPFPR